MRRMLLFVIFSVILLGGLWLGGEALLARTIRQVAQAEPSVQVQDVTPLRHLGRLGLRATQLTIDSQGRRTTLPQVMLWAPLTGLNTLHLGLPAVIEADLLGQPYKIGLDQAGARATLAPLNGMAIRRLSANSGKVTLNDQPLAEAADLQLTLSRLGHAVPRDAATSYDLKLDLRNADPRAFIPARLPEGRLSIAGQGRVWLDRILTPAALQSGDPPRPVGLRADEIRMSLGNLGLRLIGRVLADESGRAQGQLMIYTADAPAILALVVEQGLLPPGVADTIGRMLQQISDATPDTPADSSPTAGRIAAPELEPMHFPKPADNELRLPLSFRDGRMFLGPMPLGAAPRFPSPQGGA